MAHAAEHAFRCGDPVWVWTFGAYYPGVVASIEPPWSTIRWPSQGEDIEPAANENVRLGELKPYGDGIRLKITKTVEDMYYQEMIKEGFEDVLARSAGTRGALASAKPISQPVAAPIPQQAAPPMPQPILQPVAPPIPQAAKSANDAVIASTLDPFICANPL